MNRKLNRPIEQGGALVECSVLCTVMLPVYFLLASLGNIIDVKQTTIQASRYSAWEQTVGSGFQAPPDIKARFYEQADVPLITGQTGSTEAGRHQTLWQIARDDKTLASSNYTTQTLVTFQSGGGHYLNTNISDSGVAQTLGKHIENAGLAMSSRDDVDWSIEGGGVVDAGVQINVLSNPRLGQGGRDCNGKSNANLFGCVSAHNAIMVDGWGVANNGLAERRTRALVPAAMLATTGNALSKLGNIPFLAELKGLEGAFGAVDSTLLPAGVLGTGALEDYSEFSQ